MTPDVVPPPVVAPEFDRPDPGESQALLTPAATAAPDGPGVVSDESADVDESADGDESAADESTAESGALVEPAGDAESGVDDLDVDDLAVDDLVVDVQPVVDEPVADRGFDVFDADDHGAAEVVPQSAAPDPGESQALLTPAATAAPDGPGVVSDESAAADESAADESAEPDEESAESGASVEPAEGAEPVVDDLVVDEQPVVDEPGADGGSDVVESDDRVVDEVGFQPASPDPGESHPLFTPAATAAPDGPAWASGGSADVEESADDHGSTEADVDPESRALVEPAADAEPAVDEPFVADEAAGAESDESGATGDGSEADVVVVVVEPPVDELAGTEREYVTDEPDESPAVEEPADDGERALVFGAAQEPHIAAATPGRSEPLERDTERPRPSPRPRRAAAQNRTPPAGSATAPADGSPPGPEYTIKVNAESKLFHEPHSPYYRRTKADFWFRSAEDARAAGFTEWTPKKPTAG